VIRLVPDDPWDRALIDRVRPAGWANPAPAARYALVVSGGGPAGLVSAVGAAGLGARVALVERGLLGGDCLNAGCVPSKALRHAAGEARHADDPGARFPAAMERLRRLRAQIARHDSAERFRGLGIDVFLGEGAFDGPEHVTVGGARLAFHRAVIATGARPALPPIPGLAALAADGGALTNEQIFALTERPERLIVLGAGPVGCELAQAFARFGTQVTLADRAARAAPGGPRRRAGAGGAAGGGGGGAGAVGADRGGRAPGR